MAREKLKLEISRGCEVNDALAREKRMGGQTRKRRATGGWRFSLI